MRDGVAHYLSQSFSIQHISSILPHDPFLAHSYYSISHFLWESQHITNIGSSIRNLTNRQVCDAESRRNVSRAPVSALNGERHRCRRACDGLKHKASTEPIALNGKRRVNGCGASCLRRTSRSAVVQVDIELTAGCTSSIGDI